MAKKDFSSIDITPFYSALEEATTDQTQEAPQALAAQEKKRKPRKTYTAEEAEPYLESMQTAGRKNCKQVRINLALRPSVYEYVKDMSGFKGQTMTAFVNDILSASATTGETGRLYEAVKELKTKF